jgi:DNA-binding transcriptional MerR regulator
MGEWAMATYTPGQVAEKTGFSLDTLRYYERIGLLSVARTPGGQRQYCDDDIGWLEILRCLRDTGMPIQRMREYAELSRDDDTVADRIALLEEHDRDVEERIATLQAQREHIRGKVAYYRSLTELTESAAVQSS